MKEIRNRKGWKRCLWKVPYDERVAVNVHCKQSIRLEGLGSSYLSSGSTYAELIKPSFLVSGPPHPSRLWSNEYIAPYLSLFYDINSWKEFCINVVCMSSDP